jgi:serine/threonine-protein kinase
MSTGEPHVAEQTPTQLDSPTERPVIGGKYVLEKLLGEGGYSWVYLASHKQIPDLEYVVKLLKPSHLSNDQVLRRFEQEATTLARLRSPRIVKIVDYGPTEAGIPYIVSEYINGVTLGHVLREHGSLSPWLTAHLGCQILEGMKDAHAAGVIHRDLKPDNVLITREEETEYPKAMLLDFGIAKVTEQASGDADATVEGLACSPRYAAPEVLTREPNPRSDLYAVGLVLAELITGKPVYRGSHNLILASEQLSSEKVPLPDEVLDTPLGPLIKKACDKQEKKRYRNANEMLEHLQSVRDSFAEDAKERASSEIDLSSLVEKRDERPLSEAEQTALTANLHTYEQQFSGSGNLPSNIDQIVAAQQSSKVMRVLLPIVALLLIGTLGVLAWVIFRMQTSPDEDTAGTVATAGEESGSAEGNGNNAATNLESTFQRANQTVSNAINQASNNRISISTPVDDATLFYEGSEVSNLPMENVVTSNVRPLTFTVKADGYEDQELQIMQTGPVSLVAGMKEEGSSEPARVERSRTQRRQPVRRRPEPEPQPQPEPTPEPQQQQRQGSDRLGDYLDNPFE